MVWLLPLFSELKEKSQMNGPQYGLNILPLILQSMEVQFQNICLSIVRLYLSQILGCPKVKIKNKALI